MSKEIKGLLDKLDEFRAKRDLLSLERYELHDKVITPEIKAKLDEIDIEYDDKEGAVSENIRLLTDEIKASVLEHGEKVKGEFLQAVYVKGRSSWDTKGLMGYAKAHPEIDAFYMRGNPSVSIRIV